MSQDVGESEGGRMTSVAPNPSPVPAVEARLLDLFAPTAPDRPGGRHSERDTAALWRKDAAHRAKNLSQLSSSLANIASDPADRWGVVGAVGSARALARTYEALSYDCDGSAQVPCFDMVSEIAVLLGQIFGQARNIGVHVSGDEVFSPAQTRRALALICSELVINALKYAFPDDGPGMIAIRLNHEPAAIELVVADNGVGIAGEYKSGQGNGLIARLANISGAALERSTSRGGTGLCVTVRVALAVPADDGLLA